MSAKRFCDHKPEQACSSPATRSINPSTAILSLPNEVLTEALGYLSNDLEENDVLAVALSCSALRQVSQRVIHQCAHIHGRNVFPFLRTLFARPDLASSVREITLALSFQHTITTSDTSMTMILAMIARYGPPLDQGNCHIRTRRLWPFRNEDDYSRSGREKNAEPYYDKLSVLSSLVIRLTPNISLLQYDQAPCAIIKWQGCALPDLRKLAYHTNEPGPGLACIMGMASTINEISLSARKSIDLAEMRVESVKKVAIESIDIATVTLNRFLTQTPELLSLKLIINNPDATSPTCNLLQGTHGFLQNLKHLDLNMWGDRYDWNYNTASWTLRYMKNLESFAWTDFQFDRFDLWRLQPDPTLLFPPGIKKIAIYRLYTYARPSLQWLLRLIQAAQVHFPLLKDFYTCLVGESLPASRQVRKVKDAFEEAGIAFHLMGSQQLLDLQGEWADLN